MGSERTSMNNDGGYALVIFGLYAIGDDLLALLETGDPKSAKIKSDIYPEMFKKILRY